MFTVVGSTLRRPDSTVEINLGMDMDLGERAMLRPFDNTFCSGGERVRKERLTTHDRSGDFSRFLEHFWFAQCQGR